MHLYTTPSAWPELPDLADCLECPLVLLAHISGAKSMPVKPGQTLLSD